MTTEAEHKALLDDCKSWYETLAAYREKINVMKNELYFFAPGKTDAEVKVGIEHFHNQFHIQLINVHDLKHEIRYHLHQAEAHPDLSYQVPHEDLKEKVQFMTGYLDKLSEEFHAFIKQ